jgi:serine/threonine-protein kinase
MTLPGVIVHATFLDNFFTLNFLETPGWGIALEFGLFVVLAITAIFLFPRLATPWLMAAAPVLILGVLGLSLFLFVTDAVWWPPLYPCIAVAFPFATTIFLKLRSTEKAKDVEVAKVREAEDRIVEAQLEKGLAFQEKGSLDLAMATFAKLPSSQDMRTVYLNLGFDFQNRGKLEKAFVCYKRVHDLDPTFEDVASRLATLRATGVGTHAGDGSLQPSATELAQQAQSQPPPTVMSGSPSPDEAPTRIEGRLGSLPTQAGTVGSGFGQMAQGLEPQPGSPGSRYQLVKKLGKGAMGEVMLMTDAKLDRNVAIKMMRPDIDMSPQQAIEMRHRFVREAKTAGKLTHPNIVTIYDSFEGDDGVAYIAMEYVEGDTLKNLMQSTQLSVAQIKHVIINVAKGLQHAHDNGVFHRDVKPDNIMISPKTGVVKVMDFGIARVVESNMTATGSVLGTPAYMSPEQVTGQKVDGRSDVFSLGVVLFELLTGSRPFPGATPTEMMFAIVQKQPLIASTVGAARQVSVEWDPIVLKALAKETENRYQSAIELAEAVRQVRAS